MIPLNEEAGLIPVVVAPCEKVKDQTPTHTHTQSRSSVLFDEDILPTTTPNTLQLFLPHSPVRVEIGPEGAVCSRLQSQTPGGFQIPLPEPGKGGASAVLRSRFVNKTPWCGSRCH